MMRWLIETDGQSWWALHAAAMALFWAIILLFLGIIAMRPRSDPPIVGNADANVGGILSARTILEERYAKGEIGREEFLNKMRDLDVAAFRENAGKPARELP